MSKGTLSEVRKSFRQILCLRNFFNKQNYFGKRNLSEVTCGAGKIFSQNFIIWIKNSNFFSDWGAQQIALDFKELRHWINDNTFIHEDTRRYLLLLDSLRQCEGVAKLLLSKPGELVDIKPHKNRVSPMTGI